MKRVFYRLFLFLYLTAMVVSCRPDVQVDGGSTSRDPQEKEVREQEGNPTASTMDAPGPIGQVGEDSTKQKSADSMGVARQDSIVRQLPRAERMPSVMGMILGMSDTRQFAEALRRAGLEHALDGDGPYTVFVPTDQAFAKLPGSMKKILSNPNPSPDEKVRLINILHYHVLLQKQSAMFMNDNSKRPTAKGELLLFSVGPNSTVVHGVRGDNGARILRGDLNCSNGLVHVVDEVLLPKNTDVRDRKKDLLKR